MTRLDFYNTKLAIEKNNEFLEIKDFRLPVDKSLQIAAYSS